VHVRVRIASFLAVIVVAASAVAHAGRPSRQAAADLADGRELFDQRCASCHSGDADLRAPTVDALRARSPEAVVESLVNGSMRVQGARMSGPDRRAVAEYVTGKRIAADVSGAATGRCAATPADRPHLRSQASDASDSGQAAAPTASGRWSGWSPTITNTRFQSSEEADLTAADVPRLSLKWAFGFPDASSAWAHPTVAGGRLFIGSQNGTVYALDARSGCVHWTFTAAGGVRTAVAVGPAGTGGSALVFFGDTAANAYALDAETGRLVWSRRVDDHPLARITGSPVLHDGRLYVPMSSYEEAQGADPQYGCCTFRGSVTALDATSGAVLWKTYLIPDEPKPRGRSTAGVTLWGPAGAAVWSAPTIDAPRGTLYVATGNAYTAPAAPTSDAVIALDLTDGAIRWVRQVTEDDAYLTGCRAGNPNCPDRNGPDFDFGSPPVLATLPGGRTLIVVGQKSGLAFAMDPDAQGAIVWQYRAGRGGVLGGIEWGAAVDDEHAYFAVSDITLPQPGGLHVVQVATGERAWFAPPAPPACGSGRGCSAAQSAAVTAIPGVVFSGSNDGALRAYSSTDGSILWEYDTNREFQTINGVPGNGASMSGPGPAIAGGMIYVSSGYGAFGGRPGNVLLAFGVQ
jgi:polyvinyl alcohol dehydrogenase (cytochrome)